MTASIESLVSGATVHKETGTTTLVADKDFFPEGITPESLDNHVNFINRSSVAVEAAVNQLAADNYADSKREKWDGELKLTDSITLSAAVQLRETLDGQDPQFGVTECFVDYAYEQELNDWYGEFSAMNKERAAKLFAED